MSTHVPSCRECHVIWVEGRVSCPNCGWIDPLAEAYAAGRKEALETAEKVARMLPCCSGHDPFCAMCNLMALLREMDPEFAEIAKSRIGHWEPEKPIEIRIIPPCEMIETCRDTGDQRECGRPGVIRVNGVTCCLECLRAMRAENDPEAYVETPL